MSLQKAGIAAREYNNIFLRMALGAPAMALKVAAVENITNPIYGYSAPLMVGGVPTHGSMANRILIDHEFVKDNVVSLDSTLNELIM
jgi:hypothetical protein